MWSYEPHSDVIVLAIFNYSNIPIFFVCYCSEIYLNSGWRLHMSIKLVKLGGSRPDKQQVDIEKRESAWIANWVLFRIFLRLTEAFLVFHPYWGTSPQKVCPYFDTFFIYSVLDVNGYTCSIESFSYTHQTQRFSGEYKRFARKREKKGSSDTPDTWTDKYTEHTCVSLDPRIRS